MLNFERPTLRTTRKRPQALCAVLLAVLAAGCSSDCASISTRGTLETDSAEQACEENLDEVLAVGMTVDEVKEALQVNKFSGGWGGAGWTIFRARSSRFRRKTVNVSFEERGEPGAYFLKRW